MSRYEWESGTLIIPTAAYVALKKAVRDAHNQEQAELLAFAVRYYQVIVARKEREPQANLATALAEAIAEFSQSTTSSFRIRGAFAHPARFSPDDAQAYQISDLILGRSRTELHRPLPSDFPEAGKTTHVFASSDGRITFDDKAHNFSWEVFENNHAIDHARGTAVARAAFAALDKISWTRGSGGVIAGNDEYSRENREAGGGANRINATYGPRGERSDPVAQLRRRVVKVKATPQSAPARSPGRRPAG